MSAVRIWIARRLYALAYHIAPPTMTVMHRATVRNGSIIGGGRGSDIRECKIYGRPQP